MSAGVVLAVELAPLSGVAPLLFEWDPEGGEVDLRCDDSRLFSCTLDDLNELIGALRVFVDHYEAQTESDE